MLKYILKRLLYLIPVAFIISIILFGITKSMPGDPALLMLPPGIKDQETKDMLYQRAVEKLGLNDPLHVQYGRWVSNTLQGDFGYSSQYNKPVNEIIGTPLKNSIVLNFGSIILGFAIAIPIGIRSAVRKGSLFDQFWQVLTLVIMSIPIFFIGLMLIYVFALKLGMLPAGGMPLIKNDGSITYYLSWIKYLILPTIALTVGSLAGNIRYIRNAMIEVLSKDYIRTARSKGLSQKVIIYRHAFRNALIPVVTLVTFAIITLFGGSAITETIFAYNGIGKYLVDAVINRDFAIMFTMNIFYVILGLVGNLLMDIGYTLVDPRVKYD